MFYSKKLKKQKKIKHCFFSRRGGFSKGYYKSLNCGKGSADNKIKILKNLNYVSQKMNVKKNKLILMNQTHSAKVVEIKKNNYSMYLDVTIKRLKKSLHYLQNHKLSKLYSKVISEWLALI